MNIQVSLSGAHEGGKLALVLALNVLESKDGGGLLMHDRAETGLALDDNVRDTHLAAESRKEDDELDGVDIVSDDDERCFLGLNESHTVVQTVLDKQGLLGVLHRM